MDIKYRGYYPGVVGEITTAHAVYYNENWGFDVTFETEVGSELSDFIRRFDGGRDGFWAATSNRSFAGAIAIDGSNAFTDGARLRWFIVLPDFQRKGIGKKLIRQAIEFCRHKDYPKVYLWTFNGLEDARRLYEAEGFQLCEENEVSQWGQNIEEQKFELIFW